VVGATSRAPPEKHDGGENSHRHPSIGNKIHKNLSKETDEASGSFWSEGSARWITTSFITTEGAEGRVEDLKGLPHLLMALLRGTLLPALTGGKELTEKSQSGEFEVPQNPESPIVRRTWCRMKQSVEADPPPVEGEIMAMTQELRHLKVSRLTSGKRSCVVKSSNSLSGPQPDGEMEAEAQEKRRLTERMLQLDPGPTQRAPSRGPEHPP
jgi:hypothetical protein